MEAASQIESVVVFARGARIRRIASLHVALSSDAVRVRFTGLPLSVIDDTVRSEVAGPAVVNALHVAEEIVTEVETEESAELRAARKRTALAESEADRLGRALDRLAGAPLVVEDPSEDPPAAWASVVAARRQLIAQRAEREVALRDQLGNARRELDAAQRAYEVAIEHDERTGSARAAKAHEPRKYVELELVASAAGTVTIWIEYQVEAARWAPSYVARLDGEAVTFELRAVVAQETGEDWLGVALKLSTAEPTRFSSLPELAAQKIGRRQAEPAKKGFRAPPIGADELYRDYDRMFGRRVVETSFARGAFDDSTYEGRAPTAPEQIGVTKDQVWDDDSIRSAPAMATPPGGVPMAQPAPIRMAARAMPKLGASGGGGDLADEPLEAMDKAKKRFGAALAAQPHVHAAIVPRLDYAGLVIAPASSQLRGRLIAQPRPTSDTTPVLAGIAAIDQLALPPGHTTAWDHAYDYAFVTDGAVDVKSDHAWHAIALTTRRGTAKLRHVAVPREQADVFRVAALANPFEGPLLPGPIDVYDRGQFLVTSEVGYTPPGATVEVGLGVDPQVKIARNVEYHEVATGMLRGGLRLVHAIAIDVENLGGRPIELEIRERVPVAREHDDDIEVTLGTIDPAWESWTPDPAAPKAARLRGGHRWRLTVPSSAKKTVKATYEVKIAGKHELVGGNRREP